VTRAVPSGWRIATFPTTDGAPNVKLNSLTPRLTRCPPTPSNISRAFCPGLLSMTGTGEPLTVMEPVTGSVRVRAKLAVVAPVCAENLGRLIW
jgi:hypothetical protein